MLTIFLVVFVDLVGFGIIIPLLPFYGEHFGATPGDVGLLMASYSLAQFVAAPFWGRLSDRIGRRPVLLVTTAGASIAYVGLAFSTALWMLFAARLAGGLMAGNIATAFAYTADVTEPRNRAKGMGLIGAAFGLGFIFGPAIGGILAGADPSTADFRTPALVAAAMSVISFTLALLVLRESHTPATDRSARPTKDRTGEKTSRTRGAFRQVLARQSLVYLVGISFLATFVFAGMETTFAMWSRRHFSWGPEQNGYLFAFVGMISAFVQGGVVGSLSQRFGEARLVVAGSVALMAGLALIPFSHSLQVLMVAMVIVAVGFSLLSPTLNSLISLKVPPDIQGSTMGITRSATTLARVLGPAWAGALFEWFGKDWPFFASAMVMLAVTLLSLRLLRPQRAADGASPPDATS